MKLEQQYNPYKLFCGVKVHHWLMRRTEISQGAKLCFAALHEFIEENSTTQLVFDEFVKYFGSTAKETLKYLRELEKLKLIKKEKSHCQNIFGYSFNEIPSCFFE
jgi:(p)ppGpp synthase/HD superfamily hydrolase